MKSVYVTHGYTEFGDTLKLLIWENRPNADDILAAYNVVHPQVQIIEDLNYMISESMVIENN